MKTSLRIGAMVNIVGRLVLIDALILLLPMVVSIIYGESDWLTFLVASASAPPGTAASQYAPAKDS